MARDELKQLESSKSSAKLSFLNLDKKVKGIVRDGNGKRINKSYKHNRKVIKCLLESYKK